MHTPGWEQMAQSTFPGQWVDGTENELNGARFQSLEVEKKTGFPLFFLDDAPKKCRIDGSTPNWSLADIKTWLKSNKKIEWFAFIFHDSPTWYRIHVQMSWAIYSSNVLKSLKQGTLFLKNSKFPFFWVRGSWILLGFDGIWRDLMGCDGPFHDSRALYFVKKPLYKW